MRLLTWSGNLIAPGLYPSEMTEGAMKSLEKGVPDSGGAFADAHRMPSDRCPAGQCLFPNSHLKVYCATLARRTSADL